MQEIQVRCGLVSSRSIEQSSNPGFLYSMGIVERMLLAILNHVAALSWAVSVITNTSVARSIPVHAVRHHSP